MNPLPPRPLISIELLADRRKKPAALLFGSDAGATAGLVPLLDHPEFHRLTGLMSCLLRRAPALSCRLLRLVNSLGMGLLQPLKISDALQAARLGSIHVQQAAFNLLAIQACNWMLDVVREPTGGDYV